MVDMSSKLRQGVVGCILLKVDSGAEPIVAVGAGSEACGQDVFGATATSAMVSIHPNGIVLLIVATGHY
jgi:hypothetical protein